MVNIYKSDGTLILSFDNFPYGSKRICELMKEDYIQMKFSLSQPLFFPLGSYIDLDEGRFVVTEPQRPVQNTNNGAFDYDLKLEKSYMAWRNRIAKFSPQNGGNESSWSLTEQLSSHVSKILGNINLFSSAAYTADYSNVEKKDEAKHVSYNSTNIIDALTAISEAFECEWWVSGSTIYFGRCESGSSIDFEQGVNVEKMSVSGSKAEYATRIYPFGSTRNIPHNYRSVSGESTVTGIVEKRLMLPSSVNGGKNYIDSEDNLSEGEIVEKVVVFDYIYPKFVCTIKSVETYDSKTKDETTGEEITQTFYRFSVDDSFRFSKEYILQGETLKLKFESGSMNGMEFEVAFNPKGKPEKNEDGSWNKEAQLFEVVVNDSYGRELPDSHLNPKVNDTLAFSGFDISLVGSIYIPNAEQELFDESVKYIKRSKIDPNTYTCEMMGTDKAQYQYVLGQRVNLVSSANFKTGSRASRIIGFERCLDIPYDHPKYIVGEKAAYSRLGDLQSQLNAAKQDIDIIDKRKVNVDLSAYKTWTDTMAKLGMTTIDGGLILTRKIVLENTNGQIMSGINGLYNAAAQGGGVAAWYGGDMDSAKSLFRFDGSGYVANGNLSWDNQGNITLSNGAKISGSNVTIGKIAEWTDLFEKVNIGTASNPVWAIKAKYGLYTDYFLSGFGVSGDGEGGGSSTPIIDYLTSDRTDAALSANMGRELKRLIDEKTFTLTSSAITTALGYTPVNPTALDSLYIGTTRVQKSSANQALTGITSILMHRTSTKYYAAIEIDSNGSLYIQPREEGVSFNKNTIINPNGGNVGIGISSPTEKLHVNGSVRIGDAVLSWDSTNKALKVSTGFYSESFVSGFGASASGGNSGASSIKYGAQTFTANDDGQIDISDIAINSIKDVTIWGQPFNGTQNVTGNIYMPNNSAVFMKSNTGAYNNVLWLSNSNTLHLGFETADKGYATYINGADVVLRYGTARTEGIRLKNDGVTQFNGNLWLHRASTQFYTTIGIDSNGAFYIQPREEGVSYNRNTIFNYSGGSVGIGTAPSSKLHVLGDDYEILTIQRNKATGYGAAIRFENNGGFLGSFGFSGGTHYAWTDSSNTAIMALTSGGNLGIGTTAPTTKLEAYGDIKSTATGTTQRNIYVANSTGSAGIRVGTTGNRGLVDVTKNVWIIYTDGTDTLLPNNNVGIGTTIPTEKLHVNGNVKATKFIGALEGNADTATAVLDYGKTSATIKIGYNGNSLTECTYLAAYGVTSGSQVVIKDIAPSNVYGVGSANKLATPRTIWGRSFDGTANVSGDMTGVGHISMNSNCIILGRKASNNGEVQIFYPLWSDNNTYLNYGSEGNFYIRNSQSTNVMTMLNGGNVGIGTTAPSAKLEVNGSVKIGGATLSWDSTNGCLKIDKGFASSSFISAFGANTNSDVQFSRIGVNVAPSSSYYAYINGTTRIDGTTYIYGATTIGSTSTTRVLTINGTISQATSTASPTTSSTSAAVSLAGGMYIAKNLRVAGSVYYGSTPSTLSDMRFKDVIEHRLIGLDKMANAPLFAFRYKDSGLTKIGTSAQYWRDIMGEFVAGDDVLSLDYSALGVALGISLAKHVESHEERIARLERENKELKEQLKKYVA